MLDVTFAQLATTTPRNRQPIIIVEPGDYMTRAAHATGDVYAYLGDDELVYVQ